MEKAVKNVQRIEKKVDLEALKYEAEAFQRFLCVGLAGTGCGTERRNIAHWRKEKTFEELRRDFLTRDGD